MLPPNLLSQIAHNPTFIGIGGLGVLGGAFAFLRGVPGAISSWIQHRFIVEVEINKDDTLYNYLKIWFDQHPYTKKARNLTASLEWEHDYTQDSDGDYNEKRPLVTFEPAPGPHLIWFNRRPIWVTRERKDPQGSQGTIERFHIKTFGRDQTLARKIIQEALIVGFKPDTRVRIYGNRNNQWNLLVRRVPRPIDSVILDPGIAEQVHADIVNFTSKRGWYNSLGIPYRRGYLFHGVPGSGKSSFTLALAGAMKMNLHLLNLSDEELTDSSLSSLMAGVGCGEAVLIEDVDAAFVERKASDEKKHSISFSGLLNALDGVAAKEGVVVFLSTNHIERLDPALIRPGRVDLRVYFGNASPDQLRRMFQRFYGSVTDEQAERFATSVPERSISMAQVQEVLLNHAADPEQAITFAHSLTPKDNIPTDESQRAVSQRISEIRVPEDLCSMER